MALINCPECKKEISDKAASCPNCGNPISQKITETIDTVRRTQIGEMKSNKLLGTVFIALGVVGILAGLFMLLIGIGIIPLVCGIFIIILGVGNLSPTCKVDCPYCGKQNILTKGAEGNKCRSCKKTSVVNGEFLETVPD